MTHNAGEATMRDVTVGRCALPVEDPEDPAARPSAVLDPSWTLNEIIRQYPAAIVVLSRYRLDTCCGGTRTIADATQAHGINLGALFSDLEAELHA